MSRTECYCTTDDVLKQSINKLTNVPTQSEVISANVACAVPASLKQLHPRGCRRLETMNIVATATMCTVAAAVQRRRVQNSVCLCEVALVLSSCAAFDLVLVLMLW